MDSAETFVVGAGISFVAFVLWFYFGPKDSKKS
jgi:hypothetical protein